MRFDLLPFADYEVHIGHGEDTEHCLDVTQGQNTDCNSVLGVLHSMARTVPLGHPKPSNSGIFCLSLDLYGIRAPIIAAFIIAWKLTSNYPYAI